MDKIFVEEAVSELHTLQDMIRWTVSRFNAANLFFGHGTDNAWDEAVQLILPTLYLPIDVPPHVLSSRLTTSERLRIVERVVKRINERTPTAYLTNKAWFCGLEFFVDERVLVPRSPIGELIQAEFQPWLIEEPTRIMDYVQAAAVSRSRVHMRSQMQKWMRLIFQLTHCKWLSRMFKITAWSSKCSQFVQICSVIYQKRSTT